MSDGKIGLILRSQEGTERLLEAVRGFFGQAVMHHGSLNQDSPPQSLINITTGAGKTEAVLSVATEMVPSSINRDRPLVYMVPTLGLAADIVERFKDKGTYAEVYRGRQAENPTGGHMCLDLESVDLAVKVREPVQESCCESKDEAGLVRRCPHFDNCPFQAQKALKPVVWVMANDYLFLDAGWLAEPFALVVDEKFHDKAIVPVNSKDATTVTADSLDFVPDVKTKSGGLDLGAMTDLEASQRKLATAIRANGLGPLSMEALLDHGVTYEVTKEAYQMEWQIAGRGFRPYPGMPLAQRKAAVNKFRKSPGRRIWRAVRDFLHNWGHDPSAQSGQIQVTKRKSRDEAGNELESLCVRSGWLKTAKKKWAKSPVLYMDATSPGLEIVKRFFPDMTEGLSLEIDAPFTSVRYVLDAPTTIYKLSKAKNSEKNLSEIQGYVVNRSAMLGNPKTLVVGNKGPMEALKGTWPGHIDSTYYAVTAGKDEWKDIGLLIVIGQTKPKPDSVAASAACLQDKPIEPIRDESGKLARWYPKDRPKTLLRRDKAAFPVRCDYHPDDLAEAFRWSICEANLIQAIGRGRGIRREKGDPLQIDILSNVVIHGVADEVLPWSQREKVDLCEMVGLGLVAKGPSTAMLIYPEIFGEFKGEDASNWRSARYKLDKYFKNGIFVSGKMEVQHGRFFVNGKGQPRDFIYYPSICPDPKAFLEGKIGQPVTLWDGRPTKTSDMEQRGFIPLESYNDALQLFPDLFPSTKSARFALERFDGQPKHGESLVKYKPKGRGQRWRTGIAARNVDAKRWLEEAFGQEVEVEAHLVTLEEAIPTKTNVEPLAIGKVKKRFIDCETTQLGGDLISVVHKTGTAVLSMKWVN